MKTPTVSLVLDTRENAKRNNGKYPVAIRIGLGKNDSRKWSTGTYYFTKKEYQALLKHPRKEPNKDIRNKLDELLKKAERIVDALMPHFTYDEFYERFFGNSPGTLKWISHRWFTLQRRFVESI